MYNYQRGTRKKNRELFCICNSSPDVAFIFSYLFSFYLIRPFLFSPFFLYSYFFAYLYKIIYFYDERAFRIKINVSNEFFLRIRDYAKFHLDHEFLFILLRVSSHLDSIFGVCTYIIFAHLFTANPQISCKRRILNAAREGDDWGVQMAKDKTQHFVPSYWDLVKT